MTISGGGHSTATDSSGGYTLDGLPAGTHPLTPSKTGYTFSPASRLVAVPPNQLGVNFTGQLESIRGRVTTGYDEPLVNVFVGLLTAGSSSYVMTTATSEDGIYDLTGIPAAGSYQLQVVLRDGQDRSRIHWGNNGLLVAVSTPWLTQSDLGSGNRNIDFTDPSLDAGPVPQKDLDDLATMYYHTKQVQEFIAAGLGLSSIKPVARIWGFAPVPLEDAHYNTGDESIYLGWLHSVRWDFGRPMNREWHENFHHLMNMTIGVKTCSGCINHSGFEHPNTADSWTEGWSEFWACALWDYLGYSSPELYRLGLIPTSLEYNWQVWDSSVIGISREEFAVASLLWDLYDPKRTDDRDNIDLSATDIWAVLGHTRQDNNLSDIRDVYTALLQADLKNEDGTDVAAADIDQVFVAHGFYADRDGDQTRDAGEEVGWGGAQIAQMCRTSQTPTSKCQCVIRQENS